MVGQVTRSQVPVEETCNLGDIYPSPAAWEEDLRRVEEGIPALEAFRGRLGDSAATLLEFLQARDALASRFEKVLAYADSSLDADGTADENQAMAGRAYALAARLGAALSFFGNDLLSIPEEKLAVFLREQPALDAYRPQFEAIGLRRGHVLTPSAEQVVAALGEVLEAPFSLWQRVTAADLTCAPAKDEHGDEVPVSIARYQFSLSRSPDRELRRRAYESLAAGLGAHQHTLAATLAINLKRNVTLARLRGYDSAVAMFLAAEQVPEPVYRNILAEVHDGMAPHVRRLLALRQRVLGIDRLRHFDVYAPLDPGFDPTLSFAEAEKVITEALAVLGDEYAGIVSTAFAKRWIDRADNIGKRSGAWTMPVYGAHPYVFVTWGDNWRSALILAHELGHAAHGVLSARAQIISNTWTAGSEITTGLPTSLFFVEGPSTAAEVLVGRHALATTRDSRLRRFIVEQCMQTFIHNMVTHMLEAHFLQKLYDLAEAGEPITTATVLDAQGEVYERFYGDSLVPDEAARLYWAQQPHFYMGLYPYTYAAGLALGHNVVENIAAEGKPAAERWLATLRAGSTTPPLALAAMAGIDLASPEPLRRTVAYFGRLVDELEASYS